jgi:hypothetical protein
MRGLYDEGHELVRRLGHIDHVHLRARDHDVARLELRDLEHAFDHRERVCIEQVALVRRMQELYELLAVFGLAQNESGQALEQRAFTVCVIHVGVMPCRDRGIRAV